MSLCAHAVKDNATARYKGVIRIYTQCRSCMEELPVELCIHSNTEIYDQYMHVDT